MTFSRSSILPRSLTDLPNISIALAEALRRVGLTSPQALCATGAERAWMLLQQAGLIASIQQALALEGAIAGIPWQQLPHDRRSELMRFVAHATGTPP